MDNFLYFPGQKATIILEVLGTDGYRYDSLTEPYISKIFGFTINDLEDGYSLYDGYFTADDGYHDGYTQPMVKAETGLYYAKLTLPKTAGSLGTYIVEVNYMDPNTANPVVKSYNVLINAPYGNFGATTF